MKKITLKDLKRPEDISMLDKMWANTSKSHLKYQWIKQIEDYCSGVGILPEDLIKCHKEAQGGIKKNKLTKDAQKEQDAANSPIIDKKDHSKWNENYKKQKLGLK